MRKDVQKQVWEAQPVSLLLSLGVFYPFLMKITLIRIDLSSLKLKYSELIQRDVQDDINFLSNEIIRCVISTAKSQTTI